MTALTYTTFRSHIAPFGATLAGAAMAATTPEGDQIALSLGAGCGKAAPVVPARNSSALVRRGAG